MVLDYFDSVQRCVADDHLVFRFDESLGCGAGDTAFVEQVGLCLGLDGARREAPRLITGERPELLELFLELQWFRDVVFLWKMLLLPIEEGPEQRNWRIADAALRWHWDGKRFVVKGFGTSLCPKPRTERKGILGNMLAWFGAYGSESKALSRASPSVLAGSEVRTEDDVLFLKSLPSFGGALGPADSELLLTYLTAPYLRVPLLLGFFTDRHRISLLREPQLQAVLEAALFEPGPWQAPSDVTDRPPTTVPGPDRRHLATPAGLLFNELLKSPRVVMEAVLCMLRVAVEKDVGRPDSANEGLILYLVRLSVRVESFLLFLIRHGRRGAYLDRYGANYDATVRGLPSLEDVAVLEALEAAHLRLRRELQTDVFRMLRSWVNWSACRRDEFLSAACRAHAHIVLLYKNVPPERLDAHDVAVFLSSQIFLNLNHHWSEQPGDQGAARDVKAAAHPADRLGVGEVELFMAFEAKRSCLARWLRDAGPDAGKVLERVERMVTSAGVAQRKGEGLPPTAWAEFADRPGDFAPSDEVPTVQWLGPKEGEDFRPWLLRVTQGPVGSSRQVSLNLGQYGASGDGLELLPLWAARCEDYLEAYGRLDAHAIEREATTERVWKELLGHGHFIQRWEADRRGPEADHVADAWLSGGSSYSPADLEPHEAWLGRVLEPVRATVHALGALQLRLRGDVGSAPDAEVWLLGVLEAEGRSSRPLRQVKEVRVQRCPPLVELYDVVEYGRCFLRTLAFSSDSAWSFHTPSSGEMLIWSKPAQLWTLAAGRTDAAAEPAPSVLISRTTVERLGRQLFLPRRYIHGLLPDALLEGYRFWRCEAKGAPEQLVGDEWEPSDVPTRVYVTMQRGLEGASAVVRRVSLQGPVSRTLRSGEPPRSPALWDEDPAQAPEYLVNLRRGPAALANLLVRLENLSHVLAWTATEGSVVVQRVELPRLRLSFTRNGAKLHCDQHRGYWLMDRACPAAVERLVTQWGG